MNSIILDASQGVEDDFNQKLREFSDIQAFTQFIGKKVLRLMQGDGSFITITRKWLGPIVRTIVEQDGKKQSFFGNISLEYQDGFVRKT